MSSAFEILSDVVGMLGGVALLATPWNASRLKKTVRRTDDEVGDGDGLSEHDRDLLARLRASAARFNASEAAALRWGGVLLIVSFGLKLVHHLTAT